MALFGSSGESARLTRRTVLSGAAALFAGGAASALVPAHALAAELPQLRAAATGWTGRHGELLVLTADRVTETDYAIRVLDAVLPEGPSDSNGAPEATGELGPPLDVPLPAGFHPHSMAALGPALWITGALEEGHDASRPALVRIEDGTAEYVDLPLPPQIRSGIAAAIAPVGESGLAVVMEGCPDPHLAVVTRCHLALSEDAGRTWTEQLIAENLGEGYGTVLAETDEGLFAVVGDGADSQTIHVGERSGDLVLAPVANLPGAGRPMAVVASDAHVSVFSDQEGAVAETRFTAEGAPLESAADCACRGEILAVAGRRGLWLETDGSAVRIRGDR